MVAPWPIITSVALTVDAGLAGRNFAGAACPSSADTCRYAVASCAAAPLARPVMPLAPIAIAPDMVPPALGSAPRDVRAAGAVVAAVPPCTRGSAAARWVEATFGLG